MISVYIIYPSDVFRYKGKIHYCSKAGKILTTPKISFFSSRAFDLFCSEINLIYTTTGFKIKQIILEKKAKLNKVVSCTSRGFGIKLERLTLGIFRAQVILCEEYFTKKHAMLCRVPFIPLLMCIL